MAWVKFPYSRKLLLLKRKPHEVKHFYLLVRPIWHISTMWVCGMSVICCQISNLTVTQPSSLLLLILAAILTFMGENPMLPKVELLNLFLHWSSSSYQRPVLLQ